MLGFIRTIDKEVASADIDDANPTVYRIDRIENLMISDEHHKIPCKDRFEEEEFRKRVQFMFLGKLHSVKFRYKGYSIESVEDRLPTAKAVEQEDGTFVVTAEVY